MGQTLPTNWEKTYFQDLTLFIKKNVNDQEEEEGSISGEIIQRIDRIEAKKCYAFNIFEILIFYLISNETSNKTELLQ